MKVAVVGALGKMGSTVCEAVLDAPNMELAARIDTLSEAGTNPGDSFGIHTAPFYGSLETALADDQISIDVAVDFTHAKSALQNLHTLGDHGIHAVVGTSGLSPEDIKSLDAKFQNSNCFIAPNFSISAVLMMHLAELAAPFFDSAEIIEMHHEEKIDAPSATALETLRRMEAASQQWTKDPTQKENLPNARGAKGKSGIGIHSIRLKGAVAHQEIILGTEGQSLTIRQDSYNRLSFMSGVLLAIAEVPNHPGITVGLDKLLALGQDS